MGDETKPDKWRLIRGTNLKTEDRHVLLTLFLFQGNNTSAFCKQETLADEIGVDPRSIRRSLKRLNAARIVRSEWKIVNTVPMRTYAIDFEALKTVQRGDGRTPASYPETSDGRTPMSGTVGHQRPDHQDTHVLQEDPLNIQGTSRGTRTTKKRFQKPTAEQVQGYATELGQPHFDAGKFCDHYESNGWRVGGKGPMKDWRAAVRNWIRNGGTQFNGKAAYGSAEAEQAWQTVLDSVQKHSRFNPDKIMGDVGERSWQALRTIGLKQLDEACDRKRVELKAKFMKAFEGVKP